MSDDDSRLLKLDMQIIAKRLKLKDKTSNILQCNSPNTNISKLSTNKLGIHTDSKKCLKENKESKKVMKKRKPILRRPVDYTWNR